MKKIKAGNSVLSTERQKNPYTIFPLFYDRMMSHVPYRRWSSYLLKRAQKIRGSKPEHLLDIACGSGMLLQFLVKEIPFVHGFDCSQEMLEIATRRVCDVTFVKGRFEEPLPYDSESFEWMICTHDSLNYLMNNSDLISHFKEVHRILKSGGLYSFDIATLSNILEYHAGKTEIFHFRPYRIKWTKNYNSQNKILTSTILFQKNDRFSVVEIHKQRIFLLREIVMAADVAGLKSVEIDGNYTSRRPILSDTTLNFHFIKEVPGKKPEQREKELS